MKLNLLLLLIVNFNLASSQVRKSGDSSSHYIHFLPSKFYNSYNATTLPVLRIRPGDTVNTESLDALGFDKDSVKRGEQGTPLTGPFYIEGASPGDVIATSIVYLSLN